LRSGSRELKDAEGRFEQAVEVFDDIQVPRRSRRTILLGTGAARLWRHARANEKSEAAIAIYSRCGAVTMADRIEGGHSSQHQSKVRPFQARARASRQRSGRSTVPSRRRLLDTILRLAKTSAPQRCKRFLTWRNLLAHPGENSRASNLVALIGRRVRGAGGTAHARTSRDPTRCRRSVSLGRKSSTPASPAYRQPTGPSSRMKLDDAANWSTQNASRRKERSSAWPRTQSAVGLSCRASSWRPSSPERARSPYPAIRSPLVKLANNDAGSPDCSPNEFKPAPSFIPSGTIASLSWRLLCCVRSNPLIVENRCTASVRRKLRLWGTPKGPRMETLMKTVLSTFVLGLDALMLASPAGRQPQGAPGDIRRAAKGHDAARKGHQRCRGSNSTLQGTVTALKTAINRPTPKRNSR